MFQFHCWNKQKSMIQTGADTHTNTYLKLTDACYLQSKNTRDLSWNDSKGLRWPKSLRRGVKTTNKVAQTEKHRAKYRQARKQASALPSLFTVSVKYA